MSWNLRSKWPMMGDDLIGWLPPNGRVGLGGEPVDVDDYLLQYTVDGCISIKKGLGLPSSNNSYVHKPVDLADSLCPLLLSSLVSYTMLLLKLSYKPDYQAWLHSLPPLLLLLLLLLLPSSHGELAQPRKEVNVCNVIARHQKTGKKL